MIRAYWEAVREADPTEPDEAERFGGQPGQLAQLWREAGLRDVVDGSLTVSADYRDFDELWDSFLGAVGPVGAARRVARRAAGARRSAQAFHRRIGSPDGPFALTASAWYAAGIV